MDLFQKYQQPLLRLANNKWGRKFLDIDKNVPVDQKIHRVTLNSVDWLLKRNKNSVIYKSVFGIGKPLMASVLTAFNALESISMFSKDWKTWIHPIGDYRSLLHYCGLTKEFLPQVMFDDFILSAGDGVAGQTFGGPSWNTQHDAAGNTNTDSATTTGTSITSGSDGHIINRAFLPADTSAASGEVADAIIVLYVTAKTDNYSSNKHVGLVGPTTQVSTSVLQNDDYVDCGSVDNPNKWSANILIANINTSASNNFQLNATGIAGMNPGGFSLTGIREGHDIEDADPGFQTPSDVAAVTFNTSENGSNKPKLTLTLAVAGAGNPMFFQGGAVTVG